jgi:type IV pilus biogenesis protein CpaD/CtpE
MTRTAIVAAGMAVLLAGCADGAANFGASPPVALTTFHRELVFSSKASRTSNLRLRRGIDALAEGNVQAVRARILAPNIGQTREVRQALIAMGLDPSRITEATAAGRGANVSVVLFRTVATTTDCAAAIAPAFPDDPGPSLLNLSRCTQNNNLAAMVVDPADLVAPPKLGRADGAYLVSGVRSLRADRQARLPAVVTTGSGDAGAASASSSAVPAAAPVSSAANATTPTP